MLIALLMLIQNPPTYQGQINEARCPTPKAPLERISTKLIWSADSVDEVMVRDFTDKSYSALQPHRHVPSVNESCYRLFQLKS